jgi:hypothetical protein
LRDRFFAQASDVPFDCSVILVLSVSVTGAGESQRGLAVSPISHVTLRWTAIAVLVVLALLFLGRSVPAMRVSPDRIIGAFAGYKVAAEAV